MKRTHSFLKRFVVCAAIILCGILTADGTQYSPGSWWHTEVWDGVKNIWIKVCRPTRGAVTCCVIGENRPARNSTDMSCAWITIGVGPVSPGSTLSAGRFQIIAETPSWTLATPQALNFIMGYGIQRVSSETTPGDVPRELFFLDPAGETVGILFEDGESIGAPFFGAQLQKSERVIMVDPEGWAVTNEPAYYDLYPGDGSMYRFDADPDSENYLGFVLHRSSQGREETAGIGGMEVIRDEYHVLRQVLAPTRLADIVVNSEHQYEIVFYQLSDVQDKDADGYYTVGTNATPLSIWVIDNLGDENHLRVSEIVGSSTNISDYAYNPAINEWELTKGDGLQKQTRENVWDVDRENMWSTYTIRESDDTIVYKTIDKYHMFPWGLSLVEIVRDPDNLALTTSQTYHTDPDVPGSYSRVKTTINEDGSWTTFDYDANGKKVLKVQPWKDSPPGSHPDQAHATYYDYAPVDPRDDGAFNDQRPRTVTEKVLGVMVSKTYHVYGINADGERFELEEKCVDPNADYGDPSNLRSVKTYYGNAAGVQLAGRLKSVQRPDGRLETYHYEYGHYIPDMDPADCLFDPDPAGRAFRTTVIHGTTNNPNGIAYKTTKETTVLDPAHNEVLTETYVYIGGSDYERIGWVVTEFDIFGNPVKIARSNGEIEEASWGAGCCGKENETDAQGTEWAFIHDALGRMTEKIKIGTNSPADDLTLSYTYDAADRRLTKTRAGGGLALTTSNAYDAVGRLVQSVDPAGLVTTYAYADDGRTETVVSPGGATRITERYLDGRVKSIAGSGVVSQHYDYGVNADGTRWTIVYTGSSDSPIWEKRTTDGLGRTVHVKKPGFEGVVLTNNYTYNARGQLVKVSGFRCESSDIAPTIIEYNELGNWIRYGLDMNGSGNLGLASMDRINDTETRFVKDVGDWWELTTFGLYAADNSGIATTTRVRKVRLTGLETPIVSEIRTLDHLGNETIELTSVDRDNKTVTRTTLHPDSTNAELEEIVNGLLVARESRTGVTTTYEYDALGRQTGIFTESGGATPSSRLIASLTTYNALGQVESVTDAASNTTAFVYDPDTGRRIESIDALSQSTYTAYDLQGRVTNTWGATYPVAYEYDQFGRITALHTWRDEHGAPDTTTWQYDLATGLLTNKLYADGMGPSYTYTPDGKPARRTWARGIKTDYTYDSLGHIIHINYSDATPDVSATYDRLGRAVTITDALGIRTNAYDTATLALAEEQYPDGTTLYRSSDPFGRPSGISIGNYSATYGYDTLGRFSSITSSVQSVSSVVSYSYLPDSHLLAGYTLTPGGSASSLTVSRSYEPHRDLITAITNAWDDTVISAFEYENDVLGRRTTRIDTRADSPSPLTNVFAYNPRSELIEALMGTNIFAYQYDPIGNRQQSTRNEEERTYSANELNQYISVESASSVVSPAFDADGNMIELGDWTFTWDGENRLILVASNGTTVVRNTYDYMSRRIEKATDSYTNRFLYDDWHMIREVSHTATPPHTQTNSYIWGLDLSGTLQGAGGVGGLLWKLPSSGGFGGGFFYAYDANGNVTGLVDTDGVLMANYEYDPYGNMVFTDGVEAESNPYRFSTKYVDSETELLYYGYRFYSPQVGRWLNRDPIGEWGGLNLYAFCKNNSVNAVDLLGLKNTDCCGITPYNPQNKCCIDENIEKKEACSIDIYIGHGGPLGSSTLPPAESIKGTIGLVTCFADQVAAHKGREGVDVYPNPNRSTGPVYIAVGGDNYLSTEFSQELAASEEKAMGMCNHTSAPCCKSVEIAVQFSGLDSWEAKLVSGVIDYSDGSVVKTVNCD